jgi:hypothetical protein
MRLGTSSTKSTGTILDVGPQGGARRGLEETTAVRAISRQQGRVRVAEQVVDLQPLLDVAHDHGDTQEDHLTKPAGWPAPRWQR